MSSKRLQILLKVMMPVSFIFLYLLSTSCSCHWSDCHLERSGSRNACRQDSVRLQQVCDNGCQDSKDPKNHPGTPELASRTKDHVKLAT